MKSGSSKKITSGAAKIIVTSHQQQQAYPFIYFSFFLHFLVFGSLQ